MEEKYLELVSRNHGFISEAIQKKIRNCRIAVLGCGMGSLVAEMAVRTGFVEIIIADGDIVELSNLNRQAYFIKDISRKKAIALEENLRMINQELNLKVYSDFLEEEQLEEIISESDIIIDTIGIEALPVVIKIHQLARKKKKIVLDPINLGFGGVTFIFTPESVTFEEMVGIKDVDFSLIDKPEKMLPYWARLCEKFLPSYLVLPFKNFLEGVQERGWCSVPQLGIGVYITAALTVTLIIKLLEGQPVKIAPEYNFMDAMVATEPGGRPGGRPGGWEV